MKRSTFSLCMVFMLLAAGLVQAQNRVGAHAGYSIDSEDIVVGVQAEFDALDRAIGIPLLISPMAQAVLVDNATLLQFDLNAMLRIGSGTIQPKVGGGLALLYASVNDHSDTEIGVNAVGQVDFNMGGNWAPFAMVRLTFINSDSNTAIMGGLNVNI